jgi:uncharacterized glyoxalase superfamily protein PhnB
MQTLTPYLYYADVDAALAFLGEAFGFEERLRYTGPEGYTSHAEVQVGDAVVMLGRPSEDFRGPRALGGSTQATYVMVADVDALFERASAAGAEVISAPEDKEYGDRNGGLRDLEGHEWWFATHVRDVSAKDWGGEVAVSG